MESTLLGECKRIITHGFFLLRVIKYSKVGEDASTCTRSIFNLIVAMLLKDEYCLKDNNSSKAMSHVAGLFLA